MASVNDKLLNEAVRQQINWLRKGNASVKDMLALLNGADKELAKLLLKSGTELSVAKRQAVRREVNAILSQVHGAIGTEINKDVLETAVASADIEVGTLQQTIPKDVTLSLSTPNAGVIATSLRRVPMNGLQLKDWLDQLKRSDLTRTWRTINEMMVAGETTDSIVRRLIGTKGLRYKDGVRQASRNGVAMFSRTAINYAANLGRQSAWTANADIMKGVRWVATLDTRTTPICRDRDGKIFPINDGPRPPAHPNCRSTTVAVTKSFKELGIDIDEVSPGTRASMNGQVPANQTYYEWLATQSASTQKDVLGAVRYDLWKKGGVSPDKFVNDSGKVLTLAELKKLSPSAFKKTGAEAAPLSPTTPVAAPKPVTPAPLPKSDSPFLAIDTPVAQAKPVADLGGATTELKVLEYSGDALSDIQKTTFLEVSSVMDELGGYKILEKLPIKALLGLADKDKLNSLLNTMLNTANKAVNVELLGKDAAYAKKLKDTVKGDIKNLNLFIKSLPKQVDTFKANLEKVQIFKNNAAHMVPKDTPGYDLILQKIAAINPSQVAKQQVVVDNLQKTFTDFYKEGKADWTGTLLTKEELAAAKAKTAAASAAQTIQIKVPDGIVYPTKIQASQNLNAFQKSDFIQMKDVVEQFFDIDNLDLLPAKSAMSAEQNSNVFKTIETMITKFAAYADLKANKATLTELTEAANAAKGASNFAEMVIKKVSADVKQKALTTFSAKGKAGWIQHNTLNILESVQEKLPAGMDDLLNALPESVDVGHANKINKNLNDIVDYITKGTVDNDILLNKYKKLQVNQLTIIKEAHQKASITAAQATGADSLSYTELKNAIAGNGYERPGVDNPGFVNVPEEIKNIVGNKIKAIDADKTLQKSDAYQSSLLNAFNDFKTAVDKGQEATNALDLFTRTVDDLTDNQRRYAGITLRTRSYVRLPISPDTQAAEDVLTKSGLVDENSLKEAHRTFVNNFERGLKVPNIDKIQELASTELFTVSKYTSSYYAKLNDYLRGGKQYRIAADQKETYDAFTEVLNKTLDKLDTYSGMVFRGVRDGDGSILKKYKDAFAAGEIVTEKAFTSTSASPGKAFGANIRMHIRSKNGKHIQIASHHANEAEVLLKAGTKLRIVGMTDKGNDSWIIEFEEV